MEVVEQCSGSFILIVPLRDIYTSIVHTHDTRAFADAPWHSFELKERQRNCTMDVFSRVVVEGGEVPQPQGVIERFVVCDSVH